MSKVMTSDKLISSLKRRALIPTNQNTFTPEDFLEILDEEMSVGILPHVLQIHEEHYVVYEDIETTQTKDRYPIPYRAIGAKLRDVSFIDDSGAIYEMTRVTIDGISDFQTYSTITNKNVFYIEGNDVVIPNKLFTQSGKIRMHFFIRPNSLVPLASVGEVVSFDPSTGVVSMDKFPDTFSSAPKIDIVSHKSPNKIIAYDVTPVSVDLNTKSITISPSDIPTGFEDGNYICIRQETPVPQIPVELHPLLAQLAAVYCLESLGDTEGLKNAMIKLSKMETNTLKLIDDRVDGAPLKINNRNGMLRLGSGRRARTIL